MNTKYQYTESGLDDIYLSNGFTTISTQYGEATSVSEQATLHKAIGCHLVNHVSVLTPKHVRYLRKEMLLSQKQLAELIGVGDTSIRNWESTDRQDIPLSCQRVLKSLYMEFINEDSGIKKIMERTQEYSRKNNSSTELSLGYKDSLWIDDRL